MALFVLAIPSGYLFWRETTILHPDTSFVEQINSSASPTLSVATNTQTTTATTTTPAQDQVSPGITRLLNLVKECQVGSIIFGDTYNHAFVSVKAVTLKDGTLFDNTGTLNADDASILYQAALSVRYECPIQISAGRPHGDQ